MKSQKTIRPHQARQILGVSRGTFEKWIREGIVQVAQRLRPGAKNGPLGERRFYLHDILALEKEMKSIQS